MNKEDFYARTMHTPDDPERAEVRGALRDISKILIPLHRALIDSAKEDFALAYEPVDKPAHLLQLLNDHEFFAWLKPMTKLIVDIDEMARRDFEMSDARAIGVRLDQMFGNAPDAQFKEHYVPVLQRNVDVAIAHAAIRKARAKLPAA